MFAIRFTKGEKKEYGKTVFEEKGTEIFKKYENTKQQI